MPRGDTFTFMVRGRQDRGGMGAHRLLMGTRNRRRAGVGSQSWAVNCMQLSLQETETEAH